jgi:hypothetical protein
MGDLIQTGYQICLARWLTAGKRKLGAYNAWRFIIFIVAK